MPYIGYQQIFTKVQAKMKISKLSSWRQIYFYAFCLQQIITEIYKYQHLNIISLMTGIKPKFNQFPQIKIYKQLQFIYTKIFTSMSDPSDILTIVSSRNSSYLLQNATKLLRSYQQQNKLPNNSLKLISISRQLTQIYSFFLNGPQNGYKLAYVRRPIYTEIKQLTVNNNSFLVYFGLFLIDTGSKNLRQQTLLQYIDDHQNRMRDVAVHPNGKQVTIIYEHKIQKYNFYKNQRIPNSQYEFKLIKQTKLNETLRSVDAKYHPSGQFILGIKYSKKTVGNQTEIHDQMIYKLLDNFTIIEGKSLDNQCFAKGFLKFSSNWLMDIDRNNGNYAMIAGNLPTFCLFDIQKMTHQKLNFAPNTPFIPFYDTEDDDRFILPFDHSPITAHFIDRDNSGYFAIYQTLKSYVIRFESKLLSQAKDMFQIGDPRHSSFNHRPLAQMKCISIYDIDSIACMRQQLANIYIVKIDEDDEINRHIGRITNTKNSNQISSLQSVQDIFYNKQTAELCQLFNSTINCFTLSIKCTKQSQVKSLINQCQNACKAKDSNSYWSPIKMACQPCTKCLCKNSKQSFQPFVNDCKLNCSRIQHGIPFSEYYNYSRCLCHEPHQWYNDLKVCRFNCSNVQFSDPNADYSKLGTKQCKCLNGYRYLPKLDSTSHGQMGICRQICQEGLQWDQKSQNCAKQQFVQEKGGIPGWSIALIVIGILLGLGFAGYLLWRKLKGKKQKNQDAIKLSDIATERGYQNNDKQQIKSYISRQSNQKLNAVSKQLKTKSERNQMQTKFCIKKCKKIDEKRQSTQHLNCKCACQHNFHFECISNSLSKGQNQCPGCQKYLKIEDLTLIYAQQPYQIS